MRFSFFSAPVGETWDFGDGTEPVRVKSDANANHHAPDGYAVTEHAFAKPGHYIVRAQHPGQFGAIVTARLHVVVEEQPAAARNPQ